MRLRLRVSSMVVVVIALAIGACRRGTASQAATPIESGGIGDSSAFGVRIIGFDAMRNRVTYAIAAPAHVVALAVVPGKSVEPVMMRSSSDTSMMPAGVHEALVAMPREVPRGPEAPRLVDQLEYQRCVDRRVRASTRRRPTKQVVRDSLGRTTVVDGPDEVEVDAGAERNAEAMCARILTRSTGFAKAPDRDRFLLIIASDVRIPENQLLERLNAMTVTASDVPTTIAAVADALYFDRRASYEGFYKRW